MISIVIVAGGSGQRMGSNIPKQFLEIAGRPILMHTLANFFQWKSKSQLILVLPEGQITNWETLCNKHRFDIPHQVVQGGKERFHSVHNGLEVVENEWVAIHDGVRPFFTHHTLNRCMDALKESPCVVPVVSAKNSIRQVQNGENKALSREEIRIVQTPQCFHTTTIKEAFNQPYQDYFTDDASVAESNGESIFLVEGNEENFKVTTPIDLKLAEILLHQP